MEGKEKGMLLETVCVKDGAFTLEDMHWQRMRDSAMELFGRAPEVGPGSVTVPEEFRTGVVKCRILYDGDGFSCSFSRYVPRNVRTLKVVRCDDADYHLKYADRSVLDALYALRDGCDDVLIVRGGFVTDVSFGNVVFASGDGLFTPETCLLDGCMRRSLIAGGVVKTARIGVGDIFRYSALYIVNSMLEPGDIPPVEDLKCNIFL